jgi:formamidopyrimidine-DNA glycosylase
MPELPEVESIKSSIRNKVLNKKIVQVLFDTKFNQQMSTDKAEISSALLNKQIINVNRSAKILIFKLSNKLTLIIHLKISGQIIVKPATGKITRGGHPMKDEKFIKFTIVFNDGTKLMLNDPRRFAYVKILDQQELKRLIEANGVEPLGAQFTLKKFSEILDTKKNDKIKLTLMDQGKIAGIGNIYANEICFSAKISPTRINKTITAVERKKLHATTKKILTVAIRKQREGKEFDFKVYQRQGEKCASCAGKVRRINLGGRGTFFCPLCQK